MRNVTGMPENTCSNAHGKRSFASIGEEYSGDPLSLPAHGNGQRAVRGDLVERAPVQIERLGDQAERRANRVIDAINR